jgi:hypothetical protein
MRSLSTALSAALGAPVQRPALLVEVNFSPVLRLSSGPAIPSWGGHAWQAAAVGIEGLRVEPFRVQGTLILDNTDGVIGQTCFSQGVQDRTIRIWGFDAAATGTPDVVWLCDAQGSATRIDERDVRIALRHRCELTVTPRAVVGPAAGINQRLAAGTVLRINGIDYRLERET